MSNREIELHPWVHTCVCSSSLTMYPIVTKLGSALCVGSHSPRCTLFTSYSVVLARKQGREKPKAVWFSRLHTPLVRGTPENQSWAPFYTHYPAAWSWNCYSSNSTWRVRLAPSCLSQKEKVGIDPLECLSQMNSLLSRSVAEMNKFSWFLTEGLE